MIPTFHQLVDVISGQGYGCRTGTLLMLCSAPRAGKLRHRGCRQTRELVRPRSRSNAASIVSTASSSRDGLKHAIVRRLMCWIEMVTEKGHGAIQDSL
jgi:hypothetical protein